MPLPKNAGKAFLKEVIIIEDPKNDWLAEQLLKMERNNMVLPFFRWRFDTDDRRLAEKSVSEKVNQLTRTSQSDLESLSKKVENYVNLLAKNRLRDENIARKLNWGFLRYSAIIAGFPIFIAGFIANLIPFIIPKVVCDRLIKDLRFYSSVFIGGFTLLYLIYFLGSAHNRRSPCRMEGNPPGSFGPDVGIFCTLLPGDLLGTVAYHPLHPEKDLRSGTDQRAFITT